MSTLPYLRMSEPEYLAFDLAHEHEKHEFVNGEVFAMAGASPAHDCVVVNLGIALGSRLRGRACRFHTGDLRVRIDETGLYAYPDASVSCGPPEFDARNPRCLLNPTMIFEVLSPSTQAWDQGGKAAHYRRGASLRGYVMISISDRRVELFERQDGDRWLLTTHTGNDVVPLEVLGIELPLAELWERLDEIPADVA